MGTATASAETPRVAPTELDVDRADAPPGRIELGFDGGAPVAGWGLSVAGGWLEGPVTFLGPDGTASEPVRRRQTVRVGGAVALWRAVVVDARLGGAHQVGDRLRGLGEDRRRLDRWVPLDLGLGARIRVGGSARRAVFLRGDLALPTGDQRDFAGEPSWSVAWRLIGRLALPAGIVAAGTVGLRLRGEEVIVGDRLVGNEVLGAAGVVVPLPPLRPLWCAEGQVRVTAEVAAILGDDVGAGGRGPSPVEARLGVVVRPVPRWTIGVRVGRGLVDEIGSPDLRATLALAWAGR